ncbi:hypothetical protein JCM14469_00550 [Desulfatiferula olefinivorans]
MIDFLVIRQNLPFTVSIGLMVLIALIEGMGSVVGFGLSDFLDSLVPDLDWDVDAPDLDAHSGLTHLLGWLHIGRVPVMVLVILFLTGFGLTGLIIQMLANHVTGRVLPGTIASVLAVTATLPQIRVFGRIIARVMPQDETAAMSEAGYIGRTATIVIGTARAGSPAQAKFTDRHGTTHYLMVEPDVDGATFKQGQSVLIVNRDRAVYKVIEDTLPGGSGQSQTRDDR